MRRPDRAERQNLFAQWAVDDAGKARRDSRFAGQREALTHGDEIHEVVSTDTVAFDVGVVPKVSEVLHQVVVDLRTRISLTDDEVSVSQARPRNLAIPRQAVIVWQCYEDALIPKMRQIAPVRDRLTSQEGDIQVMSLDRGDVAGGPAFNQIGADGWVRRSIGSEEIGEKAGCKRREYSDAHGARFAAPKRTKFHSRMTDLSDGLASADEKSLAGLREVHTAMVPNE